MNWTWRLGNRVNLAAGCRDLLSKLSIELGLMHSEGDLGDRKSVV